MTNAVWIFAEYRSGELTGSSLEIMGEGRRLADKLKDKFCVVLLGHQVKSTAESLSQYGADTVYLVDDKILETYHPECYTDLIAGLAKAYDPGLFLFGSSDIVVDLAPRIAARLRTNLIPNCDRLDISQDGRLVYTRLTHQNKLHATLACPDARPQMATLAPGVLKIKKASAASGTIITRINPDAYLDKTRHRINITGFMKADPKTIDIAEAELIVSGGKGLENEQNFQLIHELADALGASIAGSRVAVDSRWISRERQIGQSGKTVAPVLMISCGISGATAHTFGMRETKNLIAINTDKSAPIMKLADLGVVGDLREILPELIRRLREINPNPNKG